MKGKKLDEERTVTFTRPKGVEGTRFYQFAGTCIEKNYFVSNRSDDPKDYAIKQIEGTGISMSACREIAVSEYERRNYLCIFGVTSYGWDIIQQSVILYGL